MIGFIFIGTLLGWIAAGAALVSGAGVLLALGACMLTGCTGDARRGGPVAAGLPPARPGRSLSRSGGHGAGTPAASRDAGCEPQRRPRATTAAAGPNVDCGPWTRTAGAERPLRAATVPADRDVGRGVAPGRASGADGAQAARAAMRLPPALPRPERRLSRGPWRRVRLARRAQLMAMARSLIRSPSDQFWRARAGHQWKPAWLFTRSRSVLRATHCRAAAASSSARVSRWRLAIGSSRWAHSVSAGWSSGVWGGGWTRRRPSGTARPGAPRHPALSSTSTMIRSRPAPASAREEREEREDVLEVARGKTPVER